MEQESTQTEGEKPHGQKKGWREQQGSEKKHQEDGETEGPQTAREEGDGEEIGVAERTETKGRS